jgi:hypothetical protein
MVIKFGNFRLQGHFSKNASGSWQTGLTVSLDETKHNEQCSAWFIISFETLFPLYAGVSKGRYNDEVKTLTSREILLWKNKLKFKRY